MKKILFCVLLTMLIIMAFSVLASASDTNSQSMKIKVLVDNGYTIGTAKALTEEDLDAVYDSIVSGKIVDVKTCSMEIDNLEEIETFLREYSEGVETEGAGAEETAESIQEMLDCSNKELEEEFDMSAVEIKALRQAAENSEMIDDEKEISNEITSSGSLSSSRLNYTQAVTGSSPRYKAVLSYNWIGNYTVCSRDSIAIAWGGNFNSKDELGMADYYTKEERGKWGKYKVSYLMGETAKINKGYVFSFDMVKTHDGPVYNKQGGASLTIYRNKKIGEDTKIISQYCHKVLSVKDTIAISKNPSIAIGTGYDKSPQRSTNVTY